MQKRGQYFLIAVVIIVIIIITGIVFLLTTVNRCNSLFAFDKVPDCLQNLADKGKKSNSCKLAIFPGLQDNCYFQFSRVKKDVSLCNKIEGQTQHDSCYEELVITTSSTNSMICENIFSINIKNLCKAITNRNPTICKQIINNDYYEDYCLLNVAIVKEDSSICNAITINNLKRDCNREIDHNTN